MTDQGRKVRFELTPLEAEALDSYVTTCLRPPGSKGSPWEVMRRRRGPAVITSALSRAVGKLRAALMRA